VISSPLSGLAVSTIALAPGNAMRAVGLGRRLAGVHDVHLETLQGPPSAWALDRTKVLATARNRSGFAHHDAPQAL
jgi:hypothetical protein